MVRPMVTLSREEAIQRLRSIEPEIRRLGVRRLALFGSVLRNQARADSDVDVLVEFAPTEKKPRQRMSFEPRDYLHHILLEVEYLLAQSQTVTYEPLLPMIRWACVRAQDENDGFGTRASNRSTVERRERF